MNLYFQGLILLTAYRLKIVLILSFFSGYLEANQASVGVSRVESGDDALRPALMASFQFKKNIFFQAQFYGRRIGPIKEESFLGTVGHNFTLSKNKSFLGSVGCSIQQDKITINKYQKIGHRYQYNIGLFLGLKAMITKSPITFISWESHIFPAGLATIFLVSGRKQFLSVGLGWQI